MGWPYLGFVTLIAALLALDLGVFHRRAHAVRVREALAWSAVWISLASGSRSSCTSATTTAGGAWAGGPTR